MIKTFFYLTELPDELLENFSIDQLTIYGIIIN